MSVGEDLGEAIQKDVAWSKLAKVLVSHKESNRKGGRFFVGGYFNGANRRDKDMVARTMLTLDLDDAGGLTVDELELELRMNIDCAFVAYSTYSHTSDQPRVRVVVPLACEIDPKAYRSVVKDFIRRCNLESYKWDECSYKPSQLMYMPTVKPGGEAWSVCVDGDMWKAESGGEVVNDVSDDSLEQAISDQPLDVSDDEVVTYLKAVRAEDLDYHEWVQVGMALHHQYKGEREGHGLRLWDKWSAADEWRYEGREAIERKWSSFGRGGLGGSSSVVTFATVILMAGGKAYGLEKGSFSAFDRLMSRADKLRDQGGYFKLRDEVRKVPIGGLCDDQMGMLCSRIYDRVGKSLGISKAEIKKSVRVEKKGEKGGKGKVDEETSAPDWLEGWIYVEATCTFFNVDLAYGIKREAFNAKFDRYCNELDGMSASQYALAAVAIDTVADVMYWPGAGERFQYEGLTMLNSYRDDGVKAEDGSESEAGSEVISRFLKHVEWTLRDETEREILLDWLCYVAQNPGRKVAWGVVLQGAQGTGKTYFVQLMKAVLGRNCRLVNNQSVVRGSYTDWATGSVLNCVEEIRVAGSSKFETLDKMKEFVSNDMVTIVQRYRDDREVPNFTSYFLLTNHADALPVDGGDRRYCILFSRWQCVDDINRDLGGASGAADYFRQLFQDLKNHAGELVHFIKNRSITEQFNASGRAPDTVSKQMMTDLCVSSERDFVDIAIDKYGSDIVSESFLDVTHLNQMCQIDPDIELPNAHLLSKILIEKGYRRIAGRRVKVDGDYHFVWTRGEVTPEGARNRIKGLKNGVEPLD